MPSSPIILLDTPIVAGSFAVSKIGPHVEAEKNVWKNAVKSIASSISTNCLIRVPTPVCYELMSINKEWYNFISNSQSDVFRFSSYSIPNEILKIAAHYYFSTMTMNSDGKDQKIQTMDPLIAAYCISGGHHLLTTNQHDFPESHFSLVKTEVINLRGKRGLYRSILYLLKPKQTSKE